MGEVSAAILTDLKYRQAAKPTLALHSWRLVRKRLSGMGSGYSQHRNLGLDERERLTEIQDLLLERIFARKEAIERGHNGPAEALDEEIKELKRQKENIRKWMTVGSA
jgi:hypothetical protein